MAYERNLEDEIKIVSHNELKKIMTEICDILDKYDLTPMEVVWILEEIKFQEMSNFFEYEK